METQGQHQAYHMLVDQLYKYRGSQRLLLEHLLNHLCQILKCQIPPIRVMWEECLEVYLGEGRTPSFFAHIDPLRRRLKYENALPHPAVVVRPNSARVFHLSDEGTLRLEPGDVVAAFAGEIVELAVVRTIRDNPTDRAAATWRTPGA